ncbi:MAG: fibronectin type III domain-containing protein [Lachnospiraceae bacterium]|nr:fibronectin type III domain-containing protein [Lachnospiraceae bacterium]
MSKKTRTDKWKKAGMILLFWVGLAVLGMHLQKIFRAEDPRIYQIVEGFYNEPPDSLDAVYVGASNVYAFWQAPLAWGDYGYAIYPLSVAGMPAQATKYMVEEGRKTQPDALYIINLNGFKKPKITEQSIHYLVDYMPFSVNKFRLVNELTEAQGIGVSDRLEYFFPIIRFHSGWSELSSHVFGRSLNGLKGAISYSEFLKTTKDVTEKYVITDHKAALTEEQEELLSDLLSYCKEEKVKVLFVIVPQAIGSKKQAGQLHTIADRIAAEGFDVLDLVNAVEEIGLDLTTDFYNKRHTNLHGSIKFTSYLGRYLQENYSFDDKRGNPDYADWDEAYEKYVNTISGYATDFELLHEKRDRSLAAPELSVSSGSDSAALNWSRTENADGYLVYRKSSRKGAKAWEKIASVDSAVTAYTDTGLEADATYWYTVVPVCQRDGELWYGKYDMTGETVEILKEDNDK